MSRLDYHRVCDIKALAHLDKCNFRRPKDIMIHNAKEERRLVINQAGFEMLTLCKSQLQKAQEAFVNNDSDLAAEVMHLEAHVNALDIRIGKDCERFLALYNPVAMDLRFIMAILKINADLERIADHAYNISKYIVDEEEAIAPPLFEAVNLNKTFTIVQEMLEHISTAYEEMDVKIARKVFKKDKVLDLINVNSFVTLEAELKKKPTSAKQVLTVFSVSKKVERVGDLIKNIAEEIIFYVDAKVIRHKKKK